MSKNDFHAYSQKVNFLNQEATNRLAEIKDVLSEYKSNQNPNVISYFTYSFNFSNQTDLDNLGIGTLHILNIGDQVLTNPYICIKLASKDLFNFSGKYIDSKSKRLMNSPGAWERINNNETKEEYWLKPVGIKTIEPSQQITFSNFQIKWSPQKNYSGSVTGFFYCDEFKDGVATVNPINVRGTVLDRGEENGEKPPT
ncbi:hypothetical protein VBD025_00370 [Virgibacillus flavescens]|uniref:hypothetical protein n=1 Tax=Virgibacillus flavescens TaxID=1611422 RepID=UPI003D3475DD